MKHLTFDLHLSRWGFISAGFQLIWAGIKGDKFVWFKDIPCDSVIDETGEQS